VSVTRAHACACVITELSPRDLAARYRPGLETQVNVRQGKGEQRHDDGRFSPMFTDGLNCWYNYRIDSAEDADKRQTYDLLEHFEAIGISGYDPVRGVAVGVGFDFDSIIGHKAGLSNERLEQLLDALKLLRYVEVRKSTGGAGYHIWVWFDPDNLPSVANRAEHKALARSVLQQMSQETGHDFAADIDCYGAILWICATRATAENGGLSLVRAGAEPLREFPSNWREHLDVVTGKRRRTKMHATLSDEDADAIDEAYRDRPRAPLESSHRRFIDQHIEVGFQAIWNQDFGCLNGHTAAIKLVKERFGLKGVFDTVSEGAEPSKPNCFMFPLAGGGWRVYRFGSATKEASNWEIAPSGWTTCTINEIPTLERAALLFDGVRSPQKTVEAYVFRSIEAVRNAVEALGGKIEFPEFVGERLVSVRRRDEASLIIEVAHGESDDAHVDEAWKMGWVKDRQQWGTVVKVDAETTVIDHSPWADHLVRHVSQHGKQVSLFAHTVKGWQQHTTDRVRDFLQYRGLNPFIIPRTLGWCSGHPWELVAVPFAPEYPGGRRWNRDGSRLYYAPSIVPGSTPYWDMVLQHIGRGLDDAVEADEWCQAHSIKNGAEYLERWIAVLIRMPARRLPMLFLYSQAAIPVAGEQGACGGPYPFLTALPGLLAFICSRFGR
jgi:hypothetical protein